MSLIRDLASLDTETVVAVLGAVATGGLLGKVWETITGKRKRRVDEAQVLSAISTAIREEVRKENAELRDRLEKVIGAVNGLTDVLDELFPKITGLDPAERKALRASVNLVKRAT
ncbi:Uncharacterised protein [Mycobacteroides abscessus subsp. massiliense]|nr:hypothetical protein [Mycobacteroides abscessus]SKM18040.1 Uncharacterised protein [Mycobacteroides abscessus subsp. massiliense]MDM2426918.1 hypothetical protein [Mycobacteroides abscessus]MDM2431752.1 hypothetical protein [Mycobacteroides abscessus]MDM2436635.1 hypothetical protein [Mycobacteroides abscessus]